MNIMLKISCYTDWAIFTLTNGTFVTDGTPWYVNHGVLQNNTGSFFSFGTTTTVLTINKKQGDFELATVWARVSVPNGSQYLNVTVQRGGVGLLHLEVDTPSHGAADPNGNGDFALPLTLSAIAEQEVELKLVEPPRPSRK